MSSWYTKPLNLCINGPNGWPFTIISPWTMVPWGLRKASVVIRVDFPAPLEPMIPINVPELMQPETLSRILLNVRFSLAKNLKRSRQDFFFPGLGCWTTDAYTLTSCHARVIPEWFGFRIFDLSSIINSSRSRSGWYESMVAASEHNEV